MCSYLPTHDEGGIGGRPQTPGRRFLHLFSHAPEHGLADTPEAPAGMSSLYPSMDRLRCWIEGCPQLPGRTCILHAYGKEAFQRCAAGSE
jgi:hypothetical protein